MAAAYTTDQSALHSYDADGDSGYMRASFRLAARHPGALGQWALGDR